MKRNALILIAIAIALFFVLVYWNYLNNETSEKEEKKRAAATVPLVEINLAENDLGVAGIFLASTIADVQSKLGKPSKIDKTSKDSIHNPDYTTYYEIWMYDGLEITLDSFGIKGSTHLEKPFTVTKIIVKNSTYKTNREITVGSTTADVLKTYSHANKNVDGLRINNYTDVGDVTEYINFKITDGKVSEIVIEANLI